MEEQFSLLDEVVVDVGGCGFPQLEPATAYRYGCRCSRCVVARSAQATGRSAFCEVPGCERLRVKSRRQCEDHMRKPRQSARWETANCAICNRRHGWYESQLQATREDLQELYRRTCSECRKRAMSQVRRHRLSAVWAMRLLTIESCARCGTRFPTDAKARRSAVNVDHDHSCCSGETSCGLCVRGLLCTRCNVRLGAIESVNRDMLLGDLAYIGVDLSGDSRGHSSATDLSHPGG